ncbi:GP46-like surface antigen, putative, partial [Bodo saltans]
MPNAWLEGSTAWGNLTTLSLRKCGFSGTLPTLLASTNLTLLDLSRNQLSGTFPSSLATAQLTVLDVSSNQLSGTLPADLDAASPLLTVLSFGANNFVGELP